MRKSLSHEDRSTTGWASRGVGPGSSPTLVALGTLLIVGTVSVPPIPVVLMTTSAFWFRPFVSTLPAALCEAPTCSLTNTCRDQDAKRGFSR